MQAKRHCEHLRHVPQRHWPPLRMVNILVITISQLRGSSIAARSTPAAYRQQPACSLPCDSSSTNDPRQYLSDCMGSQQHARGGGARAMRRDARPPPRASDGRGASDPIALSSQKGQFTVKWDEGAEKGENRDNGPVLHSVSHGGPHLSSHWRTARQRVICFVGMCARKRQRKFWPVKSSRQNSIKKLKVRHP